MSVIGTDAEMLSVAKIIDRAAFMKSRVKTDYNAAADNALQKARQIMELLRSK